MAGSGWESADLLTRFNQMAGRPSTEGGTLTDTIKYQYLADAEEYTIGRIASIAPKVLYGAPVALTTADGGLTFTFGTDANGYSLMPLGRATIYDSLASIPGGAWAPGVDYLDEGATIRMPNNRTFTGTLYWYGISPPHRLDASNQPVLLPPHARMLYVIKAVADFAGNGVRNAVLEERLLERYEREFGTVMTELRKHFSAGGAMGALAVPWSPAMVPTFMPILS